MLRAASRRMASTRSAAVAVCSGSSRTKLGVLFLAIGVICDKALVHRKSGTVKAWSMEIRKGRRVVYALQAHKVFVTKRRGKIFNIAHLKRLEEICRDVCSDFEAELKEFNGERDHVHLLVAFLNWSTASRAFPAGSSRYSSQQFPPSGACERAGARYGPRAISLVRLAAPLLRSFGSTSRAKGALTPRRERRGPSRYSVAFRDAS